MRLPNKLFSLKESIIVFFPIVLDYMKLSKEKSIYDLYKDTIDYFPSSKDWIDTIICLYALHAINVDTEKGVLEYAL